MQKNNNDLYNPNLLFDNRIRKLRQRVQNLRNDYQNVNHFFSKAIIETELEKAEDDLLERSFILSRSNREGSEEETTNHN